MVPQERGKPGFIERMVRLLANHPFIGFTLIAAMTAAALLWGGKIQIRSDIEALFPDSAPIVKRAKATRGFLGHRVELMVLVGGADREVNRAVAQELAETVSGWKADVDRVKFKRDVSFFETNALLYLSVSWMVIAMVSVGPVGRMIMVLDKGPSGAVVARVRVTLTGAKGLDG